MEKSVPVPKSFDGYKTKVLWNFDLFQVFILSVSLFLLLGSLFSFFFLGSWTYAFIPFLLFISIFSLVFLIDIGKMQFHKYLLRKFRAIFRDKTYLYSDSLVEKNVDLFENLNKNNLIKILLL